MRTYLVGTLSRSWTDGKTFVFADGRPLKFTLPKFGHLFSNQNMYDFIFFSFVNFLRIFFVPRPLKSKIWEPHNFARFSNKCVRRTSIWRQRRKVCYWPHDERKHFDYIYVRIRFPKCNLKHPNKRNAHTQFEWDERHPLVHAPINDASTEFYLFVHAAAVWL